MGRGHFQRTRPQEPKPEAAPKMVKRRDGSNWWATGPKAGQPAFPEQLAAEQAQEAADAETAAGGEADNLAAARQDLSQRTGVDLTDAPDAQVKYLMENEKAVDYLVKKNAPAAPVAPKGPDVKGETGLRKEYTAASQDFNKRQDGYRTVLSAGARGTAVSDHALIFAYMKTQDPTSVVRESEFAIAQSLGSFPQRIQASAQKVINGERLTPPQRQDLIDTSKEIHMANVDAQRNRRSQYEGIAESYGFDASRSLIDFIDASLLDDVAVEQPMADMSDEDLKKALGL